MGELLLKDGVAKFLSWCQVRFQPATVQFYRHHLYPFFLQFQTVGGQQCLLNVNLVTDVYPAKTDKGADCLRINFIDGKESMFVLGTLGHFQDMIGNDSLAMHEEHLPYPKSLEDVCDLMLPMIRDGYERGVREGRKP